MDLLFPQKAETQLHFSEKDISDLKYIIFLKELNFSLNEIREIILLKHTSNWIESSTLNDYLTILHKKRGEIMEDIHVLNRAIENIDKEIGNTEFRHQCGLYCRRLIPVSHQKTQNSFSFVCHIDDESLHAYVFTAKCGKAY